MKKIKKLETTKLKIGDKVKVITGTQKGIIGTLSIIDMKKGLVGVDTLSKRTVFRKNPKGELRQIEIKGVIDISNVMLWDTESNLASKVGYKVLEGQKKRYFKKSGKLV